MRHSTLSGLYQSMKKRRHRHDELGVCKSRTRQPSRNTSPSRLACLVCRACKSSARVGSCEGSSTAPRHRIRHRSVPGRPEFRPLRSQGYRDLKAAAAADGWVSQGGERQSGLASWGWMLLASTEFLAYIHGGVD